MQITGPERYKLCFDADKFVVTCSRGTPKFSGFGTLKLPKLYVVSFHKKLIYVGITRQPMRTRLRGGFTADGANGYHALILAFGAHEVYLKSVTATADYVRVISLGTAPGRNHDLVFVDLKHRGLRANGLRCAVCDGRRARVERTIGGRRGRKLNSEGHSCRSNPTDLVKANILADIDGIFIHPVGGSRGYLYCRVTIQSSLALCSGDVLLLTAACDPQH